MTKCWPLLLLLSGCSGQPAIAPEGIVSNNPCVDGILAEIAAPGQIAAVSVYSHNAAGASAPLAWSRALPAIGTSAEEVIAARPRLLLTGNLAFGGTNAALAKAGVKLHAYGVPATVSESLAQVRQIASVINRQAQGEALVVRIEAAIKPLPSRGGVGVGVVGKSNSLSTAPTPNPVEPLGPVRGTDPSTPKEEGNLSAIIWQGGGFVAGKGTLQDELLQRAGYRNASAAYGLKQWEQLPLETLIRNPPDVIFMPMTGQGDAARELAARSKLLRHVSGKARIVSFPDKLLFSGGPTIIEVMQVMKAGGS